MVRSKIDQIKRKQIRDQNCQNRGCNRSSIKKFPSLMNRWRVIIDNGNRKKEYGKNNQIRQRLCQIEREIIFKNTLFLQIFHNKISNNKDQKRS
jgi:hypothetical protein